MSRFLVLSLFLLSFHASARPLTAEERLSLLNYEQATRVMEYMAQEVDPRQLSFRDRLGLEVLKRSCSPVALLLQRIENAEALEDQSKTLATLMYGCLGGVVGVSDLYRAQR